MSILDNVIIITMIVSAFIAGMKIADKYHMQSQRELKYALQRQYVRLQAGSDADDPVQPYVAPEQGFQAPEEFVERLSSNRRAVMKVSPKAVAGDG